MPFTRDRAEYSEIEATVAAALFPGLRLPHQVLRTANARTRFFEFEELFEAPLWHAVKDLAKDWRDTELIGVVLDPDPEQYFYAEFGYYGALRAPIGSIGRELPELLAHEPPGSPADSLLTNGRVMAFATISTSVVIWAEREMGLGIVQLRDGLASSFERARQVRWFTTEEALELMAPSFSGQTVPPEFAREFLDNYSV
jgi:hypothetical protein